MGVRAWFSGGEGLRIFDSGRESALLRYSELELALRCNQENHVGSSFLLSRRKRKGEDDFLIVR